MNRQITAGLAFLVLAAVSSGQEDPNRFYSPTAGFGVIKPDAWIFAALETVAENRAKARLQDAELEALIRQRAAAPLVTILKHPEPYPDLNPSFQVGLRPLGEFEGQTAAELVAVVQPTLERAFADFRVVNPTSEVAVGGMAGARLTAEYTYTTAEGTAYPTHTDLIVVPRGKFMFLMSMSRRPDDLAAAEEIEGILSSVVIEP